MNSASEQIKKLGSQKQKKATAIVVRLMSVHGVIIITMFKCVSTIWSTKKYVNPKKNICTSP